MSVHQDPLEGMRTEGKPNNTSGNGSPSGRLVANLWKTADALREGIRDRNIA
jgi:hypothetical protein